LSFLFLYRRRAKVRACPRPCDCLQSRNVSFGTSGDFFERFHATVKGLGTIFKTGLKVLLWQVLICYKKIVFIVFFLVQNLQIRYNKSM